MTDRVRAFSVKLKIELLNKDDIDAMLKNLEHLDGKSTVDKEGKIMRIDFPAKTAFNIALEDFAYLLIEATGRKLYGSVEDGFLNFRFSDELISPALLKSIREKIEYMREEGELGEEDAEE